MKLFCFLFLFCFLSSIIHCQVEEKQNNFFDNFLIRLRSGFKSLNRRQQQNHNHTPRQFQGLGPVSSLLPNIVNYYNLWVVMSLGVIPAGHSTWYSCLGHLGTPDQHWSIGTIQSVHHNHHNTSTRSTHCHTTCTCTSTCTTCRWHGWHGWNDDGWDGTKNILLTELTIVNWTL